MIARYEGTDPNATALCLMGHTDVVPVSPDGWLNDPFGGELITAENGTAEVSFAELGSRFHGYNERIDVESLKLNTELWLNVCNRLWA